MEGKSATVQAWILQTFLRLRGCGFPVSLVEKFPERGLVVALTGTIPRGVELNPGRFVIGVVADGLPNAAAQVHVCQNPVQASWVPGGVFIPHWPQPGLLPRCAARGEKFENVRYYGHGGNLARWVSGAKFFVGLRDELRMDFDVVDVGCWHDYSEADCVLAVRGAGDHGHKPATKLYNAWLAGVPFIGGREEAYLAEGRVGVNFLPADSSDEALAWLKRLAGDLEFRRRVVEEGRLAGKRRSVGATLEVWEEFLERVIERWERVGGYSTRAGRKCWMVGRSLMTRVGTWCWRLRGGVKTCLRWALGVWDGMRNGNEEL